MLIQKSQIVKEGLIFSLQVRYFLATVMGKVRLPSHENMMASIEEEEKELKAKGEPERHYHIIGFKQVSMQNMCHILCTLDKFRDELENYLNSAILSSKKLCVLP